MFYLSKRHLLNFTHLGGCNMFANNSELQYILNRTLYLTNSTNKLSREIMKNCFSLPISGEDAKNLDIADVLAFLAKVKNNRRMQLKNSGLPVNLIYYLWFDEQSGQLRFNFINSNHPKLPFCCPLHKVTSEQEIVRQFQESDYLNGIPLEKLNECNLEDCADESIGYVLNIYTEVIFPEK